ncbi:PREDICTED: inner centromere protein-like, partial [Acanthisitta chloris]|uniref:inner centromere protein-like n=1 Tax=Acanthisitta chloris TaxID=57068 RepID=UPI0004F0F9FB
WLREVEEQGKRMLESSLRAEPGLMPKTPSQRRRPRKRQSSCLREENKEPNRRRLSRRRSGIKPVTSRLSSQHLLSQGQPRSPGCGREEVPVPGSQPGVTSQLSALPGKCPVDAHIVNLDCQDCAQGAAGSTAAPQAVLGEQLPEGVTVTELQDVSSVAGVQPGRNREESPGRTVITSTPKAAQNADPAALQGDGSPQGSKKLLFQGCHSKRMSEKPGTRRRSSVGAPRRSRRASLVEKYSLASRRENMIRKSIGRAKARKAATREESSASSRVSCQSSLEVYLEEDVTSSTRPELELNPPREKAPEELLMASKSPQTASPLAQQLSPLEQQAGNTPGNHVNPNSESQKKNQEQPHCAKSRENPSCVWTRGYRQALGVLWHGQQPGRQALSPLEDKHKTSANQAPLASSPASKVVRPLKNFLQAVQRNQLLPSPGATAQGGIKDFIKRSTPTRPNPKEKERQRLENLRKKQEAEEQRRKKVEEEKKRRQAEMKQKREDRLKKALQARERVEQMEEEKKKRMEQKILQNDEKVWFSQGWEEKVAEERSKKKVSRKHGEVDARKQKALRGEENEFEQQEPLQKRREDEAKEKGKKVLDLKNLVEQRQAAQAKERYDLGEESPKVLLLGPGQKNRYEKPESIFPALNTWLQVVKEANGQQQQLGEEKQSRQPATPGAAPGTWLSKAIKKSLSTPCLRPPEGTQGSGSPVGDGNNYGLDLNSDDSTDDENDPRKPVPAWADGAQLHQAIVHQYYHPVDLDALFGAIPSPKLEDIFYKSKPRYFKRTSSAVWHSPPGPSPACGPSCTSHI